MAKKGGMQAGMTAKNPTQQHKGDPKPASAYPSVDKDASRAATSASHSLGPRNA